MVIEQTQHRLGNVNAQTMLSVVNMLLGAQAGRPDDEHPLPPGPWGPVIRGAFERVSVLGPSPEPWRLSDTNGYGLRGDAAFGQPIPWSLVLSSILARHPELFELVGGGLQLGAKVSLNPQPLPPRIAFLMAVVRTVTERAELMQEIADSSTHNGEQQGIIFVGGYLARFADEICGNGFRLLYPFPGPPPHWFTAELEGLDLLVMGAQFEQLAKATYHSGLRQHLADAGTRFAEAGLTKVQ